MFRWTGSTWRGAGFVGVLLAALLCVPQQRAYGYEVRLTTGEFVEEVEDLRVKVRGGYLTVVRSWRAENLNKGDYRWHLNAAWADLDFEYDALDGSIKTIRRVGSPFVRTGDGVFVFDRNYFIRQLQDGTGFRWNDRAGNWILYDAEGRIREYGDLNLTIARFVRDGQGRIQEVRDNAGALALTYGYDGDRVRFIRDRAGREVRYGYTGALLTQITDVLGNVTGYQYDDRWLVGISSPGGRATSVSYAGGRVSQVARGALVSQYLFEYNRTKRQYTWLKSSGSGIRSGGTADAKGRVVSRSVNGRDTQTVSRDEAVNAATHVDERGNATTTVRDAHNNPIRIRQADGSEVRLVYEPVHNRMVERVDEAGFRTTYEYDERGNLVRQVEAVDTPETRTTTWTYDDFGQALAETVRGGEGEPATTTWTYDQYGNVATETDPLGHVTAWTYNEQGLALSETNPEGETTTWVYNAAGWLTHVTDALRQTLRIDYDADGNATRFTNPMGDVMRFDYNDNDWLVRVVDPAGGEIRFEYNADGKVERVIDALGAETLLEYDQDGNGRRVVLQTGEVIELHFGTAAEGTQGLLASVSYSTWKEEFRYDSRDRRVQRIRVIPATGGQPERREVIGFDYDPRGMLAARIDPLGNGWFHSYDALGRLASSLDPAAGETHYTYDARDNLIALTDAKGQTHRFVYDLADRLIEEIRPLGETIHYAYDGAGRLIERTSPEGERLELDYDATGRLAEERHFAVGATAPTQRVVYSYDANDQLVGYVQTGDTYSAAEYDYDVRGLLTQERITYGHGETAFTRIIGNDYTVDGVKANQRYPDGTVVAFDYDSAGRLEKQGVPGGGTISYAYDGALPVEVTMPGAVRRIDYDALRRIERIAVTASNGATVMDYGYVYDAAGNIIERATEHGEFLYDYDALDRLLGATPPAPLLAGANGGLPAERYSYDAVHNRLSSAHQPGNWEYDANNRLLGYGTGSGETGFDYDANGQTVGERQGGGLVEYRYNASERLAEVVRNGTLVARYQYDPFGRRIRKEVANQVTWFMYGGEGLLAELDAHGQATRLYGWQPNSTWGTAPLFQADRVGNAWQASFIHTDHLGTARRMTGRSGVLEWSVETGAFGAPVQAFANTKSTPLRFPGQYYDAETGSYYNYTRDYRPQLGRYQQFDRIGLAGGINAYAYANGDPLLKFDSYGEVAFVVPLGVAAAKAYLRCLINCAATGAIVEYLSEDCVDIAGVTKECAWSCLNPLNWLRGPTRASPPAASMASRSTAGRSQRLRDLANDDKLGSADRGWLQQEINAIERGNRERIRNPPGRDLAHPRGRESAKGYDYSETNLQDRGLHRLQHKHDNNGRRNPHRPK